MLSVARHQKVFLAFLLVSSLFVLPSVCLADSYEYSYELLDSPNGSTPYNLTISITETLYEYYVSQSHRPQGNDFSKYVTPDAVKPIADDLWKIYNNEEDFANGVLMLMHQIPYVESDPQKYAVETLVDNEGDCDLFSILAASIMKAGGLDVVLLLLEQQEHMWVGVHLSESPKDARTQVYFYRYDEKKYYVAETTGGKWEIGWRVGECPEILQSAGATVIPLTNYERSAPGQVASSYTTPISSEIYMSLSTDFVVAQEGVEITGSVLPSLAGENVTLYVSSGGSPLVMLASVLTDSNGEYSYIWESPASGVYSIRATWSGDEVYSGADSSTFSLVVISSEFVIIGGVLAAFIVILIIVTLSTRKKVDKEQETFEDWDFADYP
ncbi:MAG: Ig-like domain-containing protein [Candidatus Bathyarchaeota archaeon]|nr:Ig-like domain-containing protein [Candidatus Bathyarchaeum sp.]